VLGTIGCDYEHAGERWEELMQELATSRRADIDAIPRMSGGAIGWDQGAMVVEATLDRAPLAHEHYAIRVRADAATPDTEVRAAEGTIVEGSVPRRVRFTLPGFRARGLRFEILFSVVVDERAFPVSEAWQSAAVPSSE
jgi:hypothetical protein